MAKSPVIDIEHINVVNEESINIQFIHRGKNKIEEQRTDTSSSLDEITTIVC